MATKGKYNAKDYEIKDHHQELTNRMIATLEESRESGWVKPWFTCKELPFNPVTGTKYRGINAATLMTAGFSDPRFFTFKNVQDYAESNGLELHVRKGSKGTPVFKALNIVVSGDTPEGKRKVFYLVKSSRFGYKNTLGLSSTVLRSRG
ncbi:ArdC-like ssDNA-binding domain-containing protein [Diaphorobacter aerolatus]|uniref:ArdC family protein n=1 Tax=Diaphorobacter aerolatus TaxID=1288495 RepID=A0A7H0GJ97_9BURK|nr:ArdC family protein [Diaphorobacter aerolatus]QNP48363.1 ArdC family protein [Diaphorobacter aerolatus]